MPRLSRRRMDLVKLSIYAIAINGLQILAALSVALLSVFRGDRAFNGKWEQYILFTMALVVVWGAVVDIRDAFSARRISAESDMLEQAYEKLSALNGTLRAQRHDFKNHLQVVYSLMELGEHAEATAYMEKVYQDIQKVSRTLKTEIPALNALLASKLSECEDKGIVTTLSIGSAFADMPVPDWELCRVFSNLIDNAIDALSGRENAALTITTGETLHDFTFRIKNNGPQIPPALQGSIFEQGVTSKGEGRGMGLAIVQGIMRSHGGRLSLSSDAESTHFDGSIPKPMTVDI